MTTGDHVQENQSGVMEESCAPLSSNSSDILVDDKSNQAPRAILECHICMDAPTDPVATSCGHVFCWPCLSQWLQNTQKPCPVCRKVLSRNVNILSLHHGAGDAAAKSRASHGNDSAGEAAAAGNVVPPRPCNPHSFVPRLPAGSTPESETAHTIAIVRAVSELVRERHRGRSLALERARLKPLLKQRKNDLLRRKSELTQETNRMSEHIAQLKRRLALANQQLPPGWNDGWSDGA